MDQICRQFLHVFFVNLGVILNKIFVQKSFVYVCGRCVKINDFYRNKRIKDSFKPFRILNPTKAMPPNFYN